MEQRHLQLVAPEAEASKPAPERYDNRVLQEWPRIDAPPRVWVGSLPDYDAGVLHGRWIGVGRPGGEIQDDINGMLSRSPTAATTGHEAQRWSVFDAEGFGHQASDVRDDVRTLSRLGLQIKSITGAFTAWARLHEGDLAGQQRFRDAYLGHYDSAHDYVELLVDAHRLERLVEAAVPAMVRPYVGIDVRQMSADMVDGGDLLTISNPDGGVWVFNGQTQ